MARSFNGSSDIITIGDLAAQRPTGAQSHACWVYFNSTAARADLFSRWNVNGAFEAWLLTLINFGGGFTFGYFLSPDGSTADGVDSTFSPSTGTWYHVLGTWNGTTQSIYVNGALKNTATPAIASINSTTFGIFIGYSISNIPSNVFFLNGQLADCAEWNVALTAAEAAALGAGARPFQIRPSTLVGYWPFTGIQSPEPDLSGNKNNGVLTGTANAFGPPLMPFTRRMPQPMAPVGIVYVLMPQIVT
jgi:hypothetical protein